MFKAVLALFAAGEVDRFNDVNLDSKGAKSNEAILINGVNRGGLVEEVE